MGKKILVPCLDVIMIAFFPEKFTVKYRISNTKLEKGDHYYIKTQHKALGTRLLMPPGHPIILLKSN